MPSRPDDPSTKEAPSSDGDAGTLRRIAAAAGDDVRMEGLRAAVAQLRLGVDISRLDDHAVLDWAHAASAAGHLPGFGTVAAARLMRLVAKLVPALVAASASSGRSSAPTAAAAPAAAAVNDDTFGNGLDADAMASSLVQAAQNGAPFAEECSPA